MSDQMLGALKLPDKIEVQISYIKSSTSASELLDSPRPGLRPTFPHKVVGKLLG